MDSVRLRASSTIVCAKVSARVTARTGVRMEVRDRIGVKQSHGQSLAGIRAWIRVKYKSRISSGQ